MLLKIKRYGTGLTQRNNMGDGGSGKWAPDVIALLRRKDWELLTNSELNISVQTSVRVFLAKIVTLEVHSRRCLRARYHIQMTQRGLMTHTTCTVPKCLWIPFIRHDFPRVISSVVCYGLVDIFFRFFFFIVLTDFDSLEFCGSTCLQCSLPFLPG